MPASYYAPTSPNGANDGDTWTNQTTGETRTMQGGSWRTSPLAGGPFVVTGALVVGGAGPVLNAAVAFEVDAAESGVTVPLLLRDTAGASNAKNWDWIFGVGTLALRAVNDAYGAATAFVTFSRTGATPNLATFGVPIVVLGAASPVLTTTTTVTTGAGASTGTLTNAPAVGNPTKWIPINDASVTRWIPAW